MHAHIHHTDLNSDFALSCHLLTDLNLVFGKEKKRKSNRKVIWTKNRT